MAASSVAPPVPLASSRPLRTPRRAGASRGGLGGGPPGPVMAGLSSRSRGHGACPNCQVRRPSRRAPAPRGPLSRVVRFPGKNRGAMRPSRAPDPVPRLARAPARERRPRRAPPLAHPTAERAPTRRTPRAGPARRRSRTLAAAPRATPLTLARSPTTNLHAPPLVRTRATFPHSQNTNRPPRTIISSIPPPPPSRPLSRSTPTARSSARRARRAPCARAASP